MNCNQNCNQGRQCECAPKGKRKLSVTQYVQLSVVTVVLLLTICIAVTA
jgi:hypothetical protein